MGRIGGVGVACIGQKLGHSKPTGLHIFEVVDDPSPHAMFGEDVRDLVRNEVIFRILLDDPNRCEITNQASYGEMSTLTELQHLEIN